MTIAACYVSSEGVVLGADSTSTYNMRPGIVRQRMSKRGFESDDPFWKVVWSASRAMDDLNSRIVCLCNPGQMGIANGQELTPGKSLWQLRDQPQHNGNP
jgi:hypothetical protein